MSQQPEWAEARAPTLREFENLAEAAWRFAERAGA